VSFVASIKRLRDLANDAVVQSDGEYGIFDNSEM